MSHESVKNKISELKTALESTLEQDEQDVEQDID
jgi:hypothetical protein